MSGEPPERQKPFRTAGGRAAGNGQTLVPGPRVMKAWWISGILRGEFGRFAWSIRSFGWSIREICVVNWGSLGGEFGNFSGRFPEV
jgi:hypothetical protein